MRYIALLTATRPDTPPPPELMEAIMKLGEDATDAGALLDQAGLCAERGRRPGRASPAASSPSPTGRSPRPRR